MGQLEVTPPTVISKQIHMQATSYGSNEGEGFDQFNALAGKNNQMIPFGYTIKKTTHQTVWYLADASGKLSLGMGRLFIMQHSGNLIAIQVA